MSSEKIQPPWSDAQVAALNAWQADDSLPHFTHHDPERNGEQVDLIATREGWVARPGGPIVQTWAHDFMAEERTRA